MHGLRQTVILALDGYPLLEVIPTCSRKPKVPSLAVPEELTIHYSSHQPARFGVTGHFKGKWADLRSESHPKWLLDLVEQHRPRWARR